MTKYLRFITHLVVAVWISSAHADAYVDFFRALQIDNAGTPPEQIVRIFPHTFQANQEQRAIRAIPMLREAGSDTVFSLGKSQMAFWGTVAALSFLGVCIISHRLERIPSQTLVLLGISGATGLSSVLIGQSKRAVAAEEKAKLEELKRLAPGVS